MVPHFVLLIVVTLLATIGERRAAGKQLRSASWAIIALLLVLFGGFRSQAVGVDTGGYVQRFEMLASMGLYWDPFSSGEFGTKAIYAASLWIGDDPRIFLTLASSVAVICYLSSIRRIAVLPGSALFVFISFGFYLFHFNGLRQGLALGFFMLALHHVGSGDVRKYLMWGLVAGFFHATAFFALPIYLLARRGVTRMNVAVLIIGTVILAMSLGPVLELLGMINERYGAYADRRETGAHLLTVFNVGVCVIFFALRGMVDVTLRAEYDRFLVLMLAGALIFLTVTLTGSYVELTRMALYLTVAMVFAIPIVLRSARSRRQRLLMYTVLAYSGFIYYYLFLSQIGGYIPYQLWA